MELSDFQYAPFNQRGGFPRAYTLFGRDQSRLLDELNVALTVCSGGCPSPSSCFLTTPPQCSTLKDTFEEIE